jgi:putative oxidoreductase
MHFISDPFSLAMLILRLMLFVIFFAHGTQKVFSWFGGYGISGTLGFFTSLKIPKPIAYIGVFAESIASIGLLLGLFTRLSAFAMVIQMLVAIFRTHLGPGFFMNWGSQANRGEGYEFSLTLAVIALVLLIGGGGAYSLDALLW